MLEDIIASIFTPGTTNAVRIFTCCVFILLIMVLSAMVIYTNFNIHVIVMLMLACGVFLGICWFMIEMARVEAENKQKEDANKTD